MNKKNKEHIKEIISKVGIEKAPANFTKNVMQDVFISTNEEALKDAKLTAVLKEVAIENPSNSFVATIMQGVEAKSAIEFKPLISKKGWLLIGAFVIGILALMVFNEAPNEPSAIFTKMSPYFEEAKNMFKNPFKEAKLYTGANLSPILAISFLCLSSMLLFDTVLKKRLFT